MKSGKIDKIIIIPANPGFFYLNTITVTENDGSNHLEIDRREPIIAWRYEIGSDSFDEVSPITVAGEVNLSLEYPDDVSAIEVPNAEYKYMDITADGSPTFRTESELLEYLQETKTRIAEINAKTADAFGRLLVRKG